LILNHRHYTLAVQRFQIAAFPRLINFYIIIRLLAYSEIFRKSVTRNWREEYRAVSDGAIVIGTCLKAEHAKQEIQK